MLILKQPCLELCNLRGRHQPGRPGPHEAGDGRRVWRRGSQAAERASTGGLCHSRGQGLSQVLRILRV